MSCYAVGQRPPACLMFLQNSVCQEGVNTQGVASMKGRNSEKDLRRFFPLYTTTLLMLLGSGLLTTYVSLRLSAIHVGGTMIGAIIAANYVGLVIGGKVGHF